MNRQFIRLSIKWVGKSGRLYQPFCMWTPPGGNEKNAPYYYYYCVTYVDKDTVVRVTAVLKALACFGTSFKTKGFRTNATVGDFMVITETLLNLLRA
jgi:hypothetical protein